MAYVAVLSLVCLAIFPHGHDKLSSRQTLNSTRSAAHNAMSRELVTVPVEAGSMPWHHLHTAWLLLMILLARPQNISLIAIISLQNVLCRHTVTHLSRTVTPVSLTLIYLFTGQAAFYYQVPIQSNIRLTL